MISLFLNYANIFSRGNVQHSSEGPQNSQSKSSLCTRLKKLWKQTWASDSSVSFNTARKTGSAHSVAVGFANASNNCWINSLLQMIKSIPTYEEAYRVIAHEAIVANNEKSKYGKALLNALAKYDSSLAAQRAVPATVSQAVRGAFHHLISADIFIDASKQYDAYEALMHMMRCYAEILEKQNRPLPLDVFTPLVTRRQYAPKEEVIADKSYSKLPSDLTTEERQPEFQIILPLQGHCDAVKGTCSFDKLWSTYFDNPFVNESDPIIFEGPDGKVRKFQPISEKRQFAAIPQQFTVVLNRTGMSRERGVYKIDVPVDVPQTIVLNRKITGVEKRVAYKFVSAIFHQGHYGGGHYITVKAIGNDLVEINDSRSKFVDSDHMRHLEKQRVPFTGYVYHYTKV